VGSSVAALLQVLHTLDIKGEIAVRVLMRMAEVLEGRISDEEIASADAMEIRDTSKDTPDRIKQRILQHSNFVQLGGTSDLMRYLRENIRYQLDDRATMGLMRFAALARRAGLAVRESKLPFIDNDRLALLGRSMGGGVAFQALVIKPGVYDAAITYAATSSDTVDNFNKWQRYSPALGKRIIAQYGSPEKEPEFWRTMSARNYFSRVTEPILMFHGTNDESCAISWARATDDALTRAGKDATLVEYKGAGHYFYGPWTDSIKRVDQFLAKHLGSERATS
jgi:predicted esterase